MGTALCGCQRAAPGTAVASFYPSAMAARREIQAGSLFSRAGRRRSCDQSNAPRNRGTLGLRHYRQGGCGLVAGWRSTGSAVAVLVGSQGPDGLDGARTRRRRLYTADPVQERQRVLAVAAQVSQAIAEWAWQAAPDGQRHLTRAAETCYGRAASCSFPTTALRGPASR